MSKILTALSLGMAVTFAVGPVFAGEKETSPVTAARRDRLTILRLMI